MLSRSNIKAAGFALLTSLVISFVDNFVAETLKEAGFWQFQVFRAMAGISLLLVVAKLTGWRLWPVNWRHTAIRSMLVSTGLMIYFATLALLPVAQAGAGLFTGPLWVLLYSRLLFATPIRAPEILFMGCGFLGALILLQPDIHALTLLSMLPLLAGAFYGLGMVITPHWCAEENAFSLALGIFLSMGLFSLLLLLGFSLWPVASPNFLTHGWVTPTSRFFWLTLLQALGAVIALSSIARAYQIGKPSFVAMFEYSFLIFACVWAYVLWQTPTTILSLIGISVIMLSAIGMTLQVRKTSTG